MGDLYWGDNLEILRTYIPDASVDLIYLDPPFNSNRNYNVLFKETNRAESDAQIEAFTDTWHWTAQAEQTYAELIHGNNVPQKVSDLIVAMRSFIGSNDVMAYLVMMTVRLLELHRVLKPTGSIYLHCDPTASHYLKVVMDTIWGPMNFRNEIVWRRYGAHNDVGQGSKHFGRVHDVILLYVNGQGATWTQLFRPLTEDAIREQYRNVDPETGRRFTTTPLTGPGGEQKGNPVFEWNGHTRAWRYSKQTMERLHDGGKLHYSKTGYPRQKKFLDDSKGVPIQDIWDDIPSLSGSHSERLGYPTQKPEALLERIIKASSNEGDVVLDPFCGCGTAVAVAERLNRRWIGIDVTHLAIAAIVSRMEAAFPDVKIERHGEPADLGGARALAQLDRYDFQNWALAFVGARPIASDAAGKSKKGADRGIDGVISFLGQNEKAPHRCLVQVKSGAVNSGDIRDLKGTLERENAEMGIFITLAEPSAPMKLEAVEAGFYRSELMQQDYPRIQILTIAELFDQRAPQMPPRFSPYQLASRQQRDSQQRGLFDERAGGVG